MTFWHQVACQKHLVLPVLFTGVLQVWNLKAEIHLYKSCHQETLLPDVPKPKIL
uniref:Uncharacterized protein n=1 Tax=Arundo donax TaxID=35708 RepID=A0A0A9EQW4_ARUDO